MTYFQSCHTINEVKAAYRTLAMQYHPDRNSEDTTPIMQQINREYAFAIAKAAKGDTNLSTEDVEAEILNAEEYRKAVDAVINVPGLVIELCGGWLWVSGNTYPVRNSLKEAGFHWASKKAMWYFRTVEYATKSRKSHDMQEIRTKYGSQKINSSSYSRFVH